MRSAPLQEKSIAKAVNPPCNKEISERYPPVTVLILGECCYFIN